MLTQRLRSVILYILQLNLFVNIFPLIYLQNMILIDRMILYLLQTMQTWRPNQAGKMPVMSWKPCLTEITKLTQVSIMRWAAYLEMREQLFHILILESEFPGNCPKDWIWELNTRHSSLTTICWMDGKVRPSGEMMFSII